MLKVKRWPPWWWNNMRGIVKVAAVKAPGFGDRPGKCRRYRYLDWRHSDF